MGRRVATVGRVLYPRRPVDPSLRPTLLQKPDPARLVLSDGTAFCGFAAGGEAEAAGEVVFNTSMFGYQEMLTDPSYCGQVLVLTTAHVGNVGVNEDDTESERIWAEGLIVPDVTALPSSWRAQGGLIDRLVADRKPLAWGFDTRALVLHLREAGALPGVLACGGRLDADELRSKAAAASGTDGCDLTRVVARDRAEVWREGPWRYPGAVRLEAGSSRRIAVIDCGVKRSILRELVGAGAEVHVLPPDTAAEEILERGFDGVVVSNGPGDPAAVAGVPETMRALLGRMPLLGICLGHQLLARALGARTYKLRFGHHGGNHPVRDEVSGAVWITSQNHNYAVDVDSLPDGATVSLVNLTDGSVEGLVFEEAAAEGIQFHPEAGPGPHDALGAFSRFLTRCKGSS